MSKKIKSIRQIALHHELTQIHTGERVANVIEKAINEYKQQFQAPVTDEEIVREAKRLFPHNENQSESRQNHNSSKRRNFIRGAIKYFGEFARINDPELYTLPRRGESYTIPKQY